MLLDHRKIVASSHSLILEKLIYILSRSVSGYWLRNSGDAGTPIKANGFSLFFNPRSLKISSSQTFLVPTFLRTHCPGRSPYFGVRCCKLKNLKNQKIIEFPLVFWAPVLENRCYIAPKAPAFFQVPSKDKI